MYIYKYNNKQRWIIINEIAADYHYGHGRLLATQHEHIWKYQHLLGSKQARIFVLPYLGFNLLIRVSACQLQHTVISMNILCISQIGNSGGHSYSLIVFYINPNCTFSWLPTAYASCCNFIQPSKASRHVRRMLLDCVAFRLYSVSSLSSLCPWLRLQPFRFFFYFSLFSLIDISSN